MPKTEIGFSHGAPENPETKWEKKLNDGSTVIYTKTRVADGTFFIYNCEWRRENEVRAVGWQSPNDVTPEEVEQIPRFLDLLAGRI
jgi:hypothetical protein